MKKNNFIYVFIFASILFFQKVQSQSVSFAQNSFTELTREQDKFEMYLDSIDKYLYGNVEIVRSAFEECDKIIKQEISINDTLLFRHNLLKLNYLHNNSTALKAFELLIDSEKIAERNDFPKKYIKSFNYYKGYTYKAIGDLEAAQKIHYENLEKSRTEKDTSSLMTNLSSLGKLYNNEGKHDAAIKCFLELFDYSTVFDSKPMTMALTSLSLSEAYMDKEQYDKALKVLDNYYPQLEANNLAVLKSDFLFLKGLTYLTLNQIDSAEYVNTQFLELDESTKDKYAIAAYKKFIGKLYFAKKMYPDALDVYKNIIEEADTINLLDKRYAYHKIHDVYKDMGDFKSAYEYLLSYVELKNKMDEDEKRQKTTYLKIKFDSAQKEKDNAILAAQIVKKQSQQKLLYALIAICGLCLFVLFGAFYQKERYNRKLKTEVIKRTQNLKISNDKLVVLNKELDEFNRILSHDLREPLRDVVGFGQMAMKQVEDNPRAKEYLEFVVTGGKQLGQLINDVNNFQRQSKIVVEENVAIDFEAFIQKITYAIQQKYPDKDIQLESSNLNNAPKIITDPQVLTPVFQNIIDNAVKFNAHKTVNIKINYNLKDEMHCFEIEDNGIGIQSEYHTKVFNMFARLNNKLNYSGSGLGLSLAKKLIGQVNGSISVIRSQINEGTTFMVQFEKV